MASKAKAVRIQSLKGMHDILPADQPLWERLRRNMREVAEFYGFARIETPIAESAALFTHSVGEDTDVVEKQMFRLAAKEGDFVLRPEGTAPIVRSYIEHGMSHLPQPVKLWYDGPMFRYEQPQAGRFRSFHQLGFEVLGGEDDPAYDAQVVLASLRVIEGMKLKDITIAVNTIGCRACRPLYRRELVEYYRDKMKLLCPDCVRRLKSNPLRLLDCKTEGCGALKAQAPITVDYLCRSCHDHYRLVLEYFEELKIAYVLDHSLVRGFDYYSRTVFEFTAEGAPNALGGGGRYNYLIELLGGRGAPAVGAALGMERIIELVRARGIPFAAKPRPKVFLVAIGGLAKKKSFTLIEEFREAGLEVAEALGKASLRAQLRSADHEGVSLALIFGQKEAFEGTMIVRDLRSGAQEVVPLERIAETAKKRLKASG